MCLSENGHKTLACTVGDLQPGQTYRTPEGQTMLVTDGPRNLNGVTVVNVETGALAFVSLDTRLGHDRRDRLYASRSLNPVTPTAVVDLSRVSPDDSSPSDPSVAL